MLSLVPKSSAGRRRYFVDEFNDSREKWLRVWYVHCRGAARQFEIRRLVPPETLGALLGQLQAEGSKKGMLVAFKNKLISEHTHFIRVLRDLGVPLEQIRARCIYNHSKAVEAFVEEYCRTFSRATGVTPTIENHGGMKGDIVAETIVRRAVLAELLHRAMDVVRIRLADSDHISVPLDRLRNAFLAKLLTGDGTLDVSLASNRMRVTLRIVEGNPCYLRDYQRILLKAAFSARAIARCKAVVAYCSWQNLLRLYSIGAFKGTRNWPKLLCAIAIAIKGRELRSYQRLRDLSSRQTFVARDISSRYHIVGRSANLWIWSMRRHRLVTKVSRFHGHQFIRYRLTQAGRNTVRLLDQWESAYVEVGRTLNLSEPTEILKAVKVRGRGKPEHEISQNVKKDARFRGFGPKSAVKVKTHAESAEEGTEAR